MCVWGGGIWTCHVHALNSKQYVDKMFFFFIHNFFLLLQIDSFSLALCRSLFLVPSVFLM